MKLIPCFTMAAARLIDNENIVEITESMQTEERLPNQYFAIRREGERPINLKNPKLLIVAKVREAQP